MRWAGHVARMGEERGAYRVLVRKPEGKRPLGRPRHRWVDNIRMDLQEVGCGYMDWIGLAQDRDRWRMLESAVMNLRVPWNAGNFLTSCKPVSFSRTTLHHGVSILCRCEIQQRDWGFSRPEWKEGNFGPQKREEMGGYRFIIMRRFMIFTPQLISNNGQRVGQRMWHS